MQSWALMHLRKAGLGLGSNRRGEWAGIIVKLAATWPCWGLGKRLRTLLDSEKEEKKQTDPTNASSLDR